MFSFLTPLYLLGLAAAAIPLLLHLTRSRRVKKMRFSTTQFFGETFLRSRRMSRIKEWLLLAARMALFALFAVALARPVFQPAGTRGARSGRRVVALVLDNSASMAYRDGATPLFERARAAARGVLASLRPGDRAALVLAGRREGALDAPVPEPTADLDRVRRALDAAAVGTLGTDLAGALARAERLVGAGAADSREIDVFSDLQDSGWDTATPFPAARQADALYLFAQTRPAHPENAGITALQYAQALPMVGLPYVLRPNIRFTGPVPGGLEVSLWVDGEKVAERRVEPSSRGGVLRPVFLHTFAAPGWHSGWIELPPDALDRDNRRYFAVEVSAAMPVLAVDGAPSAVRRLDELFYFRAALDAGAARQGVKIDAVRPEALADARLDAYPVAVLANVAFLPEPVTQRLEQWVDRGGSLLVFPGDRTVRAWYADRLSGAARLHGGLLPARLVALAGRADAAEPIAAMGETDVAHPALAPFDDPRFATLGQVTFNAYWQLELGREAAVLMRSDGGRPLLLEKSFGRGRVMLFAGPCDRDWSNFPVHAAYVPWLQRLIAYLAQDRTAAHAFYTTGARVPVPAAAGAGLPDVRVRRPDGSAAGVVPGEPGDAAPLVIADTALAGVYSLSISRSAGEQGSGSRVQENLERPERGPSPAADSQPAASSLPPSSSRFAVNLDGYESDLRYLDDVFAAGKPPTVPRATAVEDGLKRVLPGRPRVVYVADAARAADAALAARQGRRLWDLVLVFVVALALIEPWLANRIFVRHYASGATPSPPHGGGYREGRGAG